MSLGTYTYKELQEMAKTRLGLPTHGTLNHSQNIRVVKKVNELKRELEKNNERVDLSDSRHYLSDSLRHMLMSGANDSDVEGQADWDNYKGLGDLYDSNGANTGGTFDNNYLDNVINDFANGDAAPGQTASAGPNNTAENGIPEGDTDDNSSESSDATEGEDEGENTVAGSENKGQNTPDNQGSDGAGLSNKGSGDNGGNTSKPPKDDQEEVKHHLPDANEIANDAKLAAGLAEGNPFSYAKLIKKFSLIALLFMLTIVIVLIGSISISAQDEIEIDPGFGETIPSTADASTGGEPSGTGTLLNVSGIPASLKPIFEAAGRKYNVQPALVAAIFYVEHGRSYPQRGPWASSPAGANGPFQFIEKTWEGWSCEGNSDGIFETDLGKICRGYASDGDGDNKADVQNLWDAAFAATKLLSKSDGGHNTTDIDDIRNAASRYNSGKKWSTGSTIPETAAYVPRVVTEFQRIINEM